MTIGYFQGVKIKLNIFFFVYIFTCFATQQMMQVMILFFVVIAHEIGHVMVALRLNIPVHEIELTPFGGVARMDNFLELDSEKEMLVAIAGPAVNLCLISGYLFFNRLLPLSYHQFFDFFLQANVLILFFNLLPALPLDGGRLYRACLVQKKGYQRATLTALRSGLGVGIALLALGIAGAIMGFVQINVLLIAIFMVFSWYKARKNVFYGFMGYLAIKQDEFRKKKYVKVNYIAVSKDMSVNELMQLIIPTHYNIFAIINHDGSIEQTITEAQVMFAVKKKGLNHTLAEILPKKS